MSDTTPELPPQEPDGHPLLADAVGLHQAGHVNEAARLYQFIIAQDPYHFDATHLLGVIALQQGRMAEAEQLIISALAINPTQPVALSNLGTVYLREGRLESALQQFEAGIRADPGSVTGLTNLGMVLRRLDRSREALIPLKTAYSIDPTSATVCNLLGACLLDIGDGSAAAGFFETAAGAEPDKADGWANLAVALNSLGEHERALQFAERAVAISPNSSVAVSALANVQFENGQIDLAIQTYRHAVELPNPSTQTLCAFGNALVSRGLCDDAIQQFQRGVAIDGNNAVARWKLAMAHCQPIYLDEPAIMRSRQAFVECLNDLQTWFRADRRLEAYGAVGSNQPFFLAYQPFNNREVLAQYGRICAEWMASFPMHRPVSKRETRKLGGKLRIGIASAHIRDHSVWNAITRGWVSNLDKTRFEIYLFQLGRVSDEETSRARRAVAHFEDRPTTLPAWVDGIRESMLDALIYPEIGMDPLTTQLASLRLAPVQAAAWGHPETTGLPTIDFYISAEDFESPDSQHNYTEQLIALPNLGVCVDPLAPAEIEIDLRSLGLPNDEPLLLCPGMPFKYSPIHDQLWVRIARGLQATSSGNSTLWKRLKGRWTSGHGRLVFFRSRSQSMDAMLEQRLRKAFGDAGVDFETSVSIVPNLDRARFFALMQRSALMLDTVGFSGFNTALQAAECGLPVLARECDFMRGRLASSIVRRMGMPELVARSDRVFVESAIRLAADGERCQELRAEIAKRRNVLFHDLESVRALERWLEGAITGSHGVIPGMTS